jgi:HK97 family phage prohead protease
METKISQGSATKILDAKAGIVEAFVNTMEVIDSDGDIISKAAFDNSLGSLPIPVLASHDQSEVVGKVLTARAVAGADGSQVHRLHATMQMNMETQAGREAFSNVSGDYVREWSVGFNMKPDGARVETVGGMSVRVIEDLDWVEASTVIRGASPYTQTISAKTEKDAIPAHDTSTSGVPWDSGEMVKRIRNDAEASTLKRMYAYVDPDKDEDTKSAYKFPHHNVSTDGTIGAANIKGCQSAIGVLNGAMGGADIPDSDVAGVYKHVAGHLEDADLEPAELDKAQSAPDTAEEAASGTDEVVTHEAYYEAADLELMRLKLKLAQAKKEN